MTRHQIAEKMIKKMHRGEWNMKKIYLIFCLSLCIFFVHFGLEKTDEPDRINQVHRIHFDGQYQVEDSEEWVEYKDSETKIPATDSLLLKGYIRETVPREKEIMMQLYRLNIDLYVNGTLAYHSSGQKYVDWKRVEGVKITPDDEVMIRLEQDPNNAYAGAYDNFLAKWCYGTSFGLLKQQMGENVGRILMCGFFLIMGVALVFMVAGLYYFHAVEMKGYLACGLLLISGGIFAFIDYDYITLLFDNARAINTIDFALQILICTFLLIYLKSYFRTEKYIRIANRLLGGWVTIASIYFVLRATHVINFNDVPGHMVAILVALIAAGSYYLVREYYTYKEKRMEYVLVSGLILSVFTTVELLHYHMTNAFWITSFQTGLFCFALVQFWVLLNYLSDRIKKSQQVRWLQQENMKKDAENARLELAVMQNQVSVMLSQIQPHFLYNSLSTIQVLCQMDPALAQEAMGHFIQYLRANMDSLNQKGRISFEQELNHVKNYLYIEKLRFGRKLEVVYELSTEAFNCPPLCLQTMVENAVKHGVCNKKGGGTVWIRSYKTAVGVCVEVEDNGVGFDTEQVPEDGKSHIGIINTRRRVEEEGGRIEIRSRIGEGTIVRIFLSEKRIDRTPEKGK